jgi:hypothetical protein
MLVSAEMLGPETKFIMPGRFLAVNSRVGHDFR